MLLVNIVKIEESENVLVWSFNVPVKSRFIVVENVVVYFRRLQFISFINTNTFNKYVLYMIIYIYIFNNCY